MRRFLATLCAITRSAIGEIGYWAKFNLRYMIGIINVALPYFMYIVGKWRCAEQGIQGYGYELLIPVVTLTILHYAKEIANRSNVGNNVPIPEKRFTNVDDDGEVTIETRRTQELILYMADLEDWLHRKGLL